MQEVLVVDHDVRSSVIIAAALGGMRVRGVASGKLATSILDQEPIDLAIVDAFVPGASTRIAAHAIERGVLVLMTTSDGDLLDRFRDLAIPHIVKPLTIARVHSRVSEIECDVDEALTRVSEGLARLSLSQVSSVGSLRGVRPTAAQSAEPRRRPRGQSARSGDLRALADNYRGLALCGHPTARASRLRMAGQLERWAVKQEWMEE